MGDFNKIILWDKCLLSLDRLPILWNVKNMKTVDLGCSQSMYFRYFIRKFKFSHERELQIWSALMALYGKKNLICIYLKLYKSHIFQILLFVAYLQAYLQAFEAYSKVKYWAKR